MADRDDHLDPRRRDSHLGSDHRTVRGLAGARQDRHAIAPKDTEELLRTVAGEQVTPQKRNSRFTFTTNPRFWSSENRSGINGLVFRSSL